MGAKFRLPEDLPVPRADARGADADHPILVQVALSRAAALARAGRYAEAEKLLVDLRVGRVQAIPLLHLHARILAQCGRLSEASEEWKRVLEVDPRHEGALVGLREAARILARPHWSPALLAWPAAVFAGILAIAFVLRGHARSDAAPGADELRRIATELDRSRAREDTLKMTLERIEERLSKAPAAAAAKPPVFDVKIPGLLLREELGEWAADFKERLFDPGSAELRAPAKAALSELAGKLAPEASRIGVRLLLEVGRPPADSSTLALLRARAVAAALRGPSSA